MDKDKDNQKHYIDKKKFYEEIKSYLELKNTDPDLVIPRYIAQCFLDLCENTARKKNFSSYSWVDEMKGDGIENAVRALKNFDISNSKQNPFGYFSIIVERAFIRRIQYENLRANIKFDYLSHLGMDEIFNMIEGDEGEYNYILENIKKVYDEEDRGNFSKKVSKRNKNIN